MNTINIKIKILALLIAVSLFGCKRDNIFSGSDNYITSFSLKQGNDIYAGNISEDNTIIVNIPENISVEGMVAEYSISENAKITPDPKTITDWSKSITFTVTSSSGDQKRTYQYSPTRSGVSVKSNIILSTQAEADAFASAQVSRIDGSLIIGKSSVSAAADSIRSLNALSALRNVTGNIIINSSYAKKEIDEWTNLESIGGSLIIKSTSIQKINILNLKSVGGDIEYVTPTGLTNMVFSALEILGGRLLVNVSTSFAPNTTDVAYKELSFPTLKTAKEIVLGRNKTIPELSFPELTSVESVRIEGNMYYSTAEIDAGAFLKKISFDKLEYVYKDFSLGNCQYLQELNLPQLKQVGRNFEISNTNSPGVDKLNATLLTGIGGNLTLRSVTMPDFKGLKALKTIGGDFSRSFGQSGAVVYFTGLDGLESLTTIGNSLSLNGRFPNVDALSALTSVKSIILGSDNLENLNGMKLANINSLNISSASPNLSFAGLKNSSITTLSLNFTPTVSTTYDIKGVKANNFTIRGNINGSVESILIGDETIETSLNIDGIVRLRNTKKIVGNLNCGKKSVTTYPRSMTFFDLEEVTDTAFIRYDNATIADVQYPKLKTVGQMVIYFPNGTSAVAENFPLLETVRNDFLFEGIVKDFNFPSLKTVGGLFQLVKYGTASCAVTNLNGFSQLQSAGSVDIGAFNLLVSYAGLQKVINQLTNKDQWSVYKNAYNPTYEEVKAGQLVKP